MSDYSGWMPSQIKIELRRCGGRDNGQTADNRLSGGTRLGFVLGLGLGLTLPKTSTLTINRNPHNSLFERVELVKLPNRITTTKEAPPGEYQSSLYLSLSHAASHLVGLTHKRIKQNKNILCC